MSVHAIQPGSTVRPYTPLPRREPRDLEAVSVHPPHEQPAPGRRNPASLAPAGDTGTREEGILHLLEKGRRTNVAGVRPPLSFPDQLARLHNNEMRIELLQRVTGLGDRFAELADTLLPENLQTDELGEGFSKVVYEFEESLLAADGDHGLQAAFDTLHASTLRLFTPQAEGTSPAVTDQKTDEGNPVVYPKEIPSPLSQFMSELASTFSDTMSELAEVLPNKYPLPTGESRREGAAYETLVAEYDQITSQSIIARPDHLDVHA